MHPAPVRGQRGGQRGIDATVPDTDANYLQRRGTEQRLGTEQRPGAEQRRQFPGQPRLGARPGEVVASDYNPVIG